MAAKHFEIRAGEKKAVVDRRSGSVPREYVLTVLAAAGGAVTGSVEIQGSRWLSRKEPVIVPLAAEVRVYKGFWDTLFRVHVTPDQDATVTVR